MLYNVLEELSDCQWSWETLLNLSGGRSNRFEVLCYNQESTQKANIDSCELHKLSPKVQTLYNLQPLLLQGKERLIALDSIYPHNYTNKYRTCPLNSTDLQMPKSLCFPSKHSSVVDRIEPYFSDIKFSLIAWVKMRLFKNKVSKEIIAVEKHN